MKNLKVKSMLFSLMAVLMVSVFLTSCEQETVVTNQVPDEIQEMMEKMVQDADVSAFINASFEFDKEIKERIEANQELFDMYSLTNDNDKINELIRFDEISGLLDQMLTSLSIVSTKFPKIDAIDEDAIEKFHLNNPQLGQVVNSQLIDIESRSCGSTYWNNIRYAGCVAYCAYAYLQTGPVDTNGYYSCTGDCYFRYCTGYF